MNTKHTPGPWTLSAGKTCIVQNGSAILAVKDGTGSNHSVPLADLQLIAAAPELLAALRNMVEFYDTAPRSDALGLRILADARAAIQKAEGNG